uniref:Hexosyltransferase n=1 Tax=Tetraselmis sp. GSL018 TaxID=582737 RepID=A0A061R120_9CHLO|mmetsp:Transcript_9219/g.22216  ORF Transcript_9219/g.22216 Transcript_9219/m.22216 type:complete len:319 (+) Transcript_9219:107-1063(+)
MPAVSLVEKNVVDSGTGISDRIRNKTRCSFVTFLEGKNRGYADGVLAIARSLRQHNSAFHLVVATTPTVPDELAKELASEPNVRVRPIEWLDLPKSFEEAGEKIFANKQFIANFSKLRMWEFCDEYDKLVYLDADTLPMQNIDDMFLAPHFSGVLDNMTPDAAFSSEKFQVPSFLPRASLSCSRAYFNAGVFVFEPSLEELAAMKEALRTYPVTRFAEQDFLNDFFKGRWNMLPLSFNWGKPNFWLCPELCRSEAIKVVHFSGAVKPWLRQADGQWSNSVLERAIPEERILLQDGKNGLTWAHEKWWSSFRFEAHSAS